MDATASAVSSPEPPRLDAQLSKKRKPRGPNRVKLAIKAEWQACAQTFDVTLAVAGTLLDLKAAQRAVKALTTVVRPFQTVTHLGGRNQVIRAVCGDGAVAMAGSKAVGVFELRNEARADDVAAFVCDAKLGAGISAAGVSAVLAPAATDLHFNAVSFLVALALSLFGHCLDVPVSIAQVTPGPTAAAAYPLAAFLGACPPRTDWLAVIDGFVQQAAGLLADRLATTDRVDDSPYTAPRKRQHATPTACFDAFGSPSSVGGADPAVWEPMMTLLCDSVRKLGWLGCKARAQADFWARNLRQDRPGFGGTRRYGVPCDDELLELALTDMCGVLSRCSTVTMRDVCQQIDTWQ